MPTRPSTFRPARLKTHHVNDERPNAAARGYCDKRHRAWRKAVLSRDGWQCQACGKLCTGQDASSRAHADHIIPILSGGDRFDISNGQTLCQRCHSMKTARENDFGRRGRCETR